MVAFGRILGFCWRSGRLSRWGLAAALVAFLVSSSAHSKTDPPDVSALSVLYTSLNSPSNLDGWQTSGGDPCGDGWDGIDCSGSSVTKIDLSGRKLSGSLGYQLSNLPHVTYFDVSNNNLNGDVPYQLPPNVKYLDLSGNDFTGVVPYSISQMTELEYLNLAHNKLNRQLNDMFGRLSKLSEMDLSYNSLSGALPQSLGLLSSLTTLSVQNNKLTGSINVLANLSSLNDLNVANNKFSGWIPNELKGIGKLETGGNSWSSGPAPPPPPGVHYNARPHKAEGGGASARMAGVIIVASVFGVLVVVAIILIIGLRKSSPPSSIYLDDEARISEHKQFAPLSAHESERGGIAKGFKGDAFKADSNNSIDVKSLQSPSSAGLRPSLSDRIQSFNDNEFEARLKQRVSIRPVAYSFADLETATGGFATGRLLGEGTIGRVYRAKYPDGKVLAVKKLDSALFQGSLDDLVADISKFSHPSIAKLVGYCSESGHHMLIYEYFRNGSLYDFLHQSDGFSNPLTWNTRVRIALGTARAIEYLHEVCTPSTVHKNIKTANILLDTELNPRLTDCGLAKFYERTSQNLGAGYNAPECTRPSAFTAKSDVYSFGVVMLELLTGRMPFDSSKPRSEQCLVKWATPQLHDIDALSKMVDPALRGLYPPKSISRFADVIALCVQAEPEFRPPMSEVVQSLVRVVQGGSRRMDDSSVTSDY
uniref:Protein kinase domain-containing protein n=1 Tax=Kalanchoe fedtschenkoi TaxID=63787 RepID=A0A7N0TZ04_KALFE